MQVKRIRLDMQAKKILDDYKCNYPHDPDVDNIIAVEKEFDTIFVKRESNKWYYKCKRGIDAGDIIKTFTIKSNDNIKEISILANGNRLFNQKNINCLNFFKQTIKPFYHGIPIYSIPYSVIEIIITTDGSFCKVTENHLFLEYENRRYLSEHILTFGRIIIRNGMIGILPNRDLTI